MTLYQIIQSLQVAQGSLAKQAILNAHKGNELLRKYLKATYDPAISYYQKTTPRVVLNGTDNDFSEDIVDDITYHLAKRTITGKIAIRWLALLIECQSPQSAELVELLIARSIGAGVGDTMVLKAFPNLYFQPPYQRCSLLDNKAKDRLSKLPSFYVQTKCDGSFAYVVNRVGGSVDVITRQGNTYPQPFARLLTEGVPSGMVLVSELLVYNNGVLLDRKTGNGVLNSVQQGSDMPEGHAVEVFAWDMLLEGEFVAGKSIRRYEDRFDCLARAVTSAGEHIHIVESYEVTSLAEAMIIYTQHTSQGKEGVVLKSPDSLWKNGTATDIIKLKIRFEAEYVVTGMYEGEGKAKGMCGGISIATSDGMLESNCGTGIDDKKRKAWWTDPSLIIGKVVTLEANDVIQSRDSRKKPSLSLPVFIEIRTDKSEADSYQRVLEQLEAAKQGK